MATKTKTPSSVVLVPFPDMGPPIEDPHAWLVDETTKAIRKEVAKIIRHLNVTDLDFEEPEGEQRAQVTALLDQAILCAGMAETVAHNRGFQLVQLVQAQRALIGAMQACIGKPEKKVWRPADLRRMLIRYATRLRDGQPSGESLKDLAAYYKIAAGSLVNVIAKAVAQLDQIKPPLPPDLVKVLTKRRAEGQKKRGTRTAKPPTGARVVKLTDRKR